MGQPFLLLKAKLLPFFAMRRLAASVGQLGFPKVKQLYVYVISALCKWIYFWGVRLNAEKKDVRDAPAPLDTHRAPSRAPDGLTELWASFAARLDKGDRMGSALHWQSSSSSA